MSDFAGDYGTAPGIGQSSLSPPDDRSLSMDPQVTYRREQLFYPTPLIPEGQRIAYQLRQRTLIFTGLAAGGVGTQRIPFDVAGVVYQMTAAAYLTDDSDLPRGRSDLDTFLVQFQHSNGDRLTEQPVLGSTILAPATRPAFLSRSGWHFNNGASLVCEVTALIVNLRIDIVAWHYETRGPTNITP